ncbi:adhesin/hemagglutinin [Yersinia frederiksenii]|nr:adhesin/hemagglutinin [Yersinia frederiksenii]
MILQSTQESQTLAGSNRSSGGSLGVAIGAGQGGWGISVSASLNQGKGKESGDGLTNTETTVNAGNLINLTSGRDALLQGAQVSGETVTAQISRDLLLQSQQDSDNYDSKQTSVSGGISVAVIGAGGSANLSMSRDKLHSNYDSVQEQSGIFAGKGGFDITVGEHTQLDGAVIASTADKSKNSLDTGTLGFSNIENKADFKAEHQGGSLSTGGPVGSDLLSNLGSVVLSGLGNSGHAEGTTQAAVSDGTLTIRDTDKQQQNVDDLSRDTDNANGSIGPIFDKEKEQNRLKEAQLIGEIGGQAIDIARTQGKIIATNAANEKMKDVKPEDIAAAEKQWKKANPNKVPTAEDINQQIYETAYNQAFNESGLGTGGPVQRAMQAATAAVQGLSGGNMAAALANGAAPYLTKLIADTLPEDPVSRTFAHAAVNAALAAAQGNNALVGAGGAVTGELIGMIALNAYGKPVSELSETEKQKVSALATLAAGLAGGLIGDSTADTVAGAQTGKTVVENNSLSGDQGRESIKQVTNNLKDQVRDKLGEGTLSAIVNSIIGAAGDTGDALLGGADYGADAAIALISCAMDDSYCTQALSDLSGKNQAAADTLKALMKGDTWSAVADTVKQAAGGNQTALEATGGMLAGLFLPGMKVPDVVKLIDPNIKIRERSI